MDAVSVRVAEPLRFLLPLRDRRDGARRLRHDPDATVGHLVQAAGVPLTEAGPVLLDGEPVAVSARTRPGSVLDVAEAPRPQPVPAGGFLLDVGLGALARRLRLLGLDAAYDRTAADPALVDRARAEDRVLLTQDRGLLMRRALPAGALVRGGDPDEQLADVLERFSPALAPLTRCTACGGRLWPVPKESVADLLQPGTRRSYDEFSRCAACGRVFWRGAHARRIDRLIAAATPPGLGSRTVGGRAQARNMAADQPSLPGSTRHPVARSRAAGMPEPTATVDVTLVLRRRTELPARAEPMSRAEFAEAHGADPRDIALVRDTLSAAGVEVTAVDPASRRVQARGQVATLERLFGTSLELVESPDPVGRGAVTHRQRTGSLALPEPLAGVVVAVLGLDDRPQGRARFRPAAAPTTSFTPPELGRVYRFPDGVTGKGATLAILELGGGYTDADLAAYWAQIGLTAPPSVRAVGVDGGTNAPEGTPSGADGEVLLDIEVAGALAPGADLVVYFAPNTDRGFLDALATAVHADPTPTAVSISWGQSEDEWTGQAMTAMDDAMADAAALGVTVCVAAGDDGSRDNASDRQSHVDFPASSPHALACGGTTLHADADTGTVTSETVWFHGVGQGGTGGGVSDVFGVPDWQGGVGVPNDTDTGQPGRGVPDVAADADPATGYQVRVDGSDMVIGGTSAVAPLWAALACRLAEALGRPPGLLQPALYAGVGAGRPAPGFRDVTSGSNGVYQAGPGWDACTGLGVPDGEALLARLRSSGG